jgi:YD repeat-containing protein
MIGRLEVFLSVFVILLSVSLASPVRAEIAGPGWFSVQAAPSPELQATADDEGTELLGMESAISSSALLVQQTSAATATTEISELARALQYDPKLIYDYVHNHIRYIPYYGSLKGATLTYLDGCGNDFDQASLMIALLRASGYTASYVYGKMTIPGSELANWLGVDQIADTIGTVLGSGGIPTDALYTDGRAKFARVWVRASINGSSYDFDPAFKSHQYISKIDLGEALGYSQSNLLAAAGGVVGTDYIQSLNEAGLANKLVEYSSNLVSVIRDQHPNSSVEEIVGGRSIIENELTEYPTSLSFSPEVAEVWDDIPASKTATLRIQHEGIDHTISIPDIAGKRLTITYAGGDHHPELRLDNGLIASGNGTSTGQQYDCTITIDHPYSSSSGQYCDQTSEYHLKSGAAYAVVSAYGGTSDALLQKRQKELDSAMADGFSQSSEQVMGETLNIMGLTWLKECMFADELLGALAETVNIRHHMVGVMAQEEGYYIDVKTAMSSLISRHNVDSDKLAHFKASASLSSAFEHGVLEQLMGSGPPGISTMKLFQIANSSGYKVFKANSGNYSGIRSQLSNYSQSMLDQFQSTVNSGYTLILPQNGQLGLGSWSGCGYIQSYQSGTSMSLGMIIGGAYGGYAAEPYTADPVEVEGDAQTNAANTPSAANSYRDQSTGINHTSVEPVDMAGGAYLFDHTDLSLGGAAPLGLAFARSYNSGQHLEDRGLGYGWTHGYDIRLSRTSHENPGLGKRQPVDAAAVIAALYANLDLLKTQDDAKGWAVAALINKWAVDRLIDNAVTVHLGHGLMEYIKLADGTYAAPPGITAQLLDNGNGTFSLRERFGTRLDFNGSDRISRWEDGDGNALSFTYSGENLSGATDAFGRSLTMGYSGSRIHSVADSTGRSVSYGYDGSGNLTGYTDPEGKVWGYGYDGRHRMTSLSTPLGVTTATNAYDSLGRVQTQTVPRQGGDTAVYAFYFSGFRNVEEDPEGAQTIYYYDHKGRSTGEENALGHRTGREYDGQNHIVESLDPLLNLTRYSYDGAHHLIGVENALAEETEYVYDAQHRKTDAVVSGGVKMYGK